MKRTAICILALILTSLLLLSGCHEPQQSGTQSSINASKLRENEVLKGWSGEFSNEKLISTINEYKSNYANFVLEKNSTSNISFEVDFEVASAGVTLLSRVDDTDIEIELHGCIDLYIMGVECEGRTVTIPVNWWYAHDYSWVNDCMIWSYLVRVKDVQGNNHYYYFRVDYSAYA